MKQITACCELSCHDCEAFVAKSHGDCEKMKDVADGWSKILKMALKLEDIRGEFREKAEIRGMP